MHIAITGASSGIGAALVREFSAAGWSVTLIARRETLLRAIAEELPQPSHIVVQDLSDPDTCCDWIAAAEAALGPLDVLVNNAGVQVLGPTDQVDPAEGERSLRLNLLVPLRMTRHVLPAMLARGAGVIVDIASMAALAPTPGMFYYNAGKAGLAAASEALRGELLRTPVHVLTVYPGIIDETDMGKRGLESYERSSLLDAQPRGTAAELARLTRRAVEKRQDRVIYPRMNTVARWLPGPTRWLMDRFTPPMRG
jgi:short-subunit dehydrogenase